MKIKIIKLLKIKTKQKIKFMYIKHKKMLKMKNLLIKKFFRVQYLKNKLNFSKNKEFNFLDQSR